MLLSVSNKRVDLGDMGISLKTLIRTLEPKKPNVFFAHIPKTGGTSIDEALRRKYRLSSFRVFAASTYQVADILQQQRIHEIREHLVVYEMLQGTQYISGHISFNPHIWESFNNQYLFMTVLRHPVKRYISKYFYNAYKKSDHCKTDCSSLEEYMTSSPGIASASEYVRFLSGGLNHPDWSTSEMLDQAKQNISKFQIVGCLENLNALSEKFQTLAGFPLKIPHARKNPVSKPDVSSSTIQAIETLCSHDMELYNYVATQLS